MTAITEFESGLIESGDRGFNIKIWIIKEKILLDRVHPQYYKRKSNPICVTASKTLILSDREVLLIRKSNKICSQISSKVRKSSETQTVVLYKLYVHG